MVRVKQREARVGLGARSGWAGGVTPHAQLCTQVACPGTGPAGIGPFRHAGGVGIGALV